MKILVIGGSYFLGRVFTIVASKEHELTLVNRGKYSMKEFGVREFILDRYDFSGIKSLPKEDYDAVIDFCAYNPSDIETFVECYGGKIKKYVLISTCDVYKRGIDCKKNEDTPIETRRFEGQVGDYIAGKIKLEEEVKQMCMKKGMEYGIIRPSIIYGPYNYAQKESEYIRRIVRNIKIPMPFDSNSKFQLVYVKDVANAVLEAAKKEGNNVYNVCPEEIDYESFFETLIKIVGKENVMFRYLTVNKLLQENEFAPFPLTIEETELYDGSKITSECDFTYTSLEEGMKKTFNAFKNVYSN